MRFVGVLVQSKVCVFVSSGCVDPIMSLVEQRVGADGSRRESPSATASVLGYTSRSLRTSPAIYRGCFNDNIGNN